MNIFPVIHHQSEALTLRNAAIAQEAGVPGVFLIDMTGVNDPSMFLAGRKVKAEFGLQVGLNCLGFAITEVVQLCVNNGFEMAWTDRCLTHSHNGWSDSALESLMRLATQVEVSVFAGVAFKYQPVEPFPSQAYAKALSYGLVPTTSGVATGVASSVDRLSSMRGAAGRLALASGVSAANVLDYSGIVSDVLVSSSIATADNPDLVSEPKLKELMKKVRDLS